MSTLPQEAKCAYVIFVMAVFWVTEVVPIAVTSLMPIFLLPMMGLLTARNTSSAYINVMLCVCVSVCVCV